MARRKKRSAYVIKDSEVRAIRRKYQAGKSTRELEEEFGVSHMQVHRIVTGKARKGVK